MYQVLWPADILLQNLYTLDDARIHVILKVSRMIGSVAHVCVNNTLDYKNEQRKKNK